MISRFNPARTRELVGTVRVTPPAAIERIVHFAGYAQRAWTATATAERCALLSTAADLVQPKIAELATLMARETGKVRADCAGEIGFALTFLRWVAGRAPAVLADRVTDDDLGRLLLRRSPYGVVAAITPWNAPVILTMLKVGPALAAGNAIVVKPSPLAPFAVEAVMKIMASGLPEGVLQVVQGDGDTGAALVGHRGVHKVAFTGGSAAGRLVAAAAAGQTTPCVLELGGNDPVLLLPDADLSAEPMRRLVMAAYATSGQVCMAAKRVYVPAARHEEFVAAFTEAAAGLLRVGDPLAEGVTMGPVITEQAAARVESLVEDAVERGGRVHPVGTVAPDTDWDGGHFVRPVLVAGLPDDAPLVAEEQFGPALPVLAYTAEDDLVARANAGDLGLGASVWSADEERAFALAGRIEAGFVFVNTHNRTGMALRAPFGGVKRSGYGREYGDEGITEYAQTRVLHAPASFRPGAAGSASPTAYPS
ncbi:aldehyde dehydrogenase family protein [Hamadaea tsunoensis]|uniref:aldehyde dehydrogenase family protein n=1 Tax=Hamadaea tsunoensis TaxID=53368 RepID=UPI00040AA263|nr:aldehyde dehydrogenase family protein [Hamadaea tsunoensis]